MIKKYFLILLSILFQISMSGQDVLNPPIVVGANLNESGESSFYKGWPLLLSAVFFNENAYQEMYQ